MMRPFDRIQWPWACALLVLAALVAMPACKSDEDTSSQSEERQTDEKEAKQETSDEVDDMAKNREAYGLPLPPQLSSVERLDDEVRVVTTMSLDELAKFYESRLQDYEVVRPPQKIRVLGLREYMPEIYGDRFAGTVKLYYNPARPDPSAASADGSDESNPDGAPSRNRSAQAAYQRTTPLHERQKGDPVTDRTADGELLAPGAKWGEPYTPPPGSPLHKERYKSNWGKPYGEWIPQ